MKSAELKETSDYKQPHLHLWCSVLCLFCCWVKPVRILDLDLWLVWCVFRLYFFIAVKIAKVVPPIWIAVAGQLGLSEQQYSLNFIDPFSCFWNILYHTKCDVGMHHGFEFWLVYWYLVSVRTFSIMYGYILFSMLTNHQIRHQTTTSKMICQPGDFRWSLNLPRGLCGTVGISGLTCSLYQSRACIHHTHNGWSLHQVCSVVYVLLLLWKSSGNCESCCTTEINATRDCTG